MPVSVDTAEAVIDGNFGFSIQRRDGTLEYDRLRANYDAAFGRLRASVSRLSTITQQVSRDKPAEEAAQRRIDQALGVYQNCRNTLADSLVKLQKFRKKRNGS